MGLPGAGFDGLNPRSLFGRIPGMLRYSYARAPALLSCRCIAVFVTSLVVPLLTMPAWAQFPGGLGAGQSGGNLLGNLSGGGLPSVTQAGPANTAGVLQYCVQNNYLNGGATDAAKS